MVHQLLSLLYRECSTLLQDAEVCALCIQEREEAALTGTVCRPTTTALAGRGRASTQRM